MSDEKPEELRDGFLFVGSWLWLDFLNTAPAKLGELIKAPEDLKRWAKAAGLPRIAAFTRADVTAAHKLRGALGAIYEALKAESALPRAAVSVINAHLEKAPRLRHLSASAHPTVVETVESDVLGRVASDLTDFLGDYETSRLRQCAGEGCTLAFYDTARNATRRWCSMSACGNRSKVNRHRGKEE